MKVNEKLSVLMILEKSKLSKDGKMPITIRLTVDSKRSELSLGQKIAPDLWNQEGGFAIGNSKDSRSINAAIDKAKTKLRQHYDLLELQHPYVSSAMVKESYQGKPKEEVKSKTLLEATSFVLERMEKKVERQKCAKGTLTKWKTTENKVTAFISDVYKQKDLPLDQLKYSFAEDFVDYLMLDKGIETNTAMKYLKNIKHVVKTAVERDWLTKSPIASYPCSYVHPDRDILDQSEILAMYNKDITIQRLREVRDAYLFMCFTGYAYKDASMLTPDHVMNYFDGEEWIVKNREKTWCRENVPLLPIAKQIIERYKNDPYCLANNLLLPINSNQKYNAYLKELADICGINKNLTTHTARHTFATTVTLANGVPLETVSALLGHKSIKTTQIYAKIVATKVSMDMGRLKQKLILQMPQSLLEKSFAA